MRAPNFGAVWLRRRLWWPLVVRAVRTDWVNGRNGIYGGGICHGAQSVKWVCKYAAASGFSVRRRRRRVLVLVVVY